jgi:PAS domain S-box-containing protein
MTAMTTHSMKPDFRAVFESLPGLYLVLQADAPRYTIVAASDAYMRQTLTERQAIVGRGMFEVFPENPDDPDTTAGQNFSASFRRVIAHRAPDTMPIQRHDIRRPPAQGGGFEERWWRPVNSPVFGPDGDIAYIVHCAEDVTSLVRLGQDSQEALNEKQQWVRELFEGAPDAIFIAGPDGRCTDANSAACRLLGYSRQEIVGRSIVDFVPQEDLARQAALKRHILAGGVEVSEWQLRRKDGTYVPVELSANALPNGFMQGIARDLTDRHAAEAALRMSEAMFSGIVSISADAIISIDEDRRIIIFNEGAEKTFGYSKAEAIGAPLDLLVPEPFRDVHRRHIARFVADEASARQMGRRRSAISGRRKNGDVFPAEAAISKIEVGGKVVLTVSLRDVTEKKRIEDALRSSVARFEIALKGARASVMEQDRDLRLTWFYSPVLLSAEAETALGKTDFELLPRYEAERTTALKRRVLESGMPAREVIQSTVNGHARWFDVTVEPLRDSEGQTTGVISVNWDISERKRIEDEERLLAETGRILVSAGSDQTALLTGVASVIAHNIADWCTVDLVDEGNVRRLKIVHSDPAMAATCAALERYPVHRRRNLISDVVESQRPVLIDELPSGYLESRALDDEHLRLLRSLDPTSFIIAPLVARGQSLGTLTFGASGGSRRYGLRDVSIAERLATVVALAMDNARLYQHLEGAVRARDEVLGVVAHDLRNPLNTILAAARIIEAHLSEEGANIGQTSVGVILRSVSRATRLINDLLDVTSIDAGQLSVVHDHFSAEQLVLDAVEGQQVLASSAALGLQVVVEAPLPEIWGDRDRCLQVFENLIGNAIKFTPRGGRIMVGAAAGAGEVHFSVADTGRGIAPENLPHVFDRFWQAKHAKRAGAGLGLRICKGIVEANGGRIWVESSHGGGTTFHFTVPTWNAVEHVSPLREPESSQSAPTIRGG